MLLSLDTYDLIEPCDVIKEFLLHPFFFSRRIGFYGLLGCMLYCGIFRVSQITENLKGWKGILVVFGPSLDFVFPFGRHASISKTFCNCSIGNFLQIEPLLLVGILFCGFGFLYALVFFQFFSHYQLGEMMYNSDDLREKEIKFTDV